MNEAFSITTLLLLSSILSMWLSQRAMYHTRSEVIRRQRIAKKRVLEIVGKGTGNGDQIRETLQPFLSQEHEVTIVRYRRIEGISLGLSLLSIVALFVMYVISHRLTL